ncbi:MAG: CopD family protein [Candidatus Micrarchaeia archaeon]
MAELIYAFFKFLHYVGVALGAGGATIATLLMMKSEKDAKLAPLTASFMPDISKVISSAVILLFLSGIGMAWALSGDLSNAPTQELFQIKYALYAILIVAGGYLSLKVMPKMQEEAKKGNTAEVAKLKKQGKILGTGSLLIWYAILALMALR